MKTRERDGYTFLQSDHTFSKHRPNFIVTIICPLNGFWPFIRCTAWITCMWSGRRL